MGLEHEMHVCVLGLGVGVKAAYIWPFLDPPMAGGRSLMYWNAFLYIFLSL